MCYFYLFLKYFIDQTNTRNMPNISEILAFCFGGRWTIFLSLFLTDVAIFLALTQIKEIPFPYPAWSIPTRRNHFQVRITPNLFLNSWKMWVVIPRSGARLISTCLNQIKSNQVFEGIVWILIIIFLPNYSSLGCGIGYGYLHRIPTRPFEEGKKISFPGNSPSEPVSPLKDGFTEVRPWTLFMLFY